MSAPALDWKELTALEPRLLELERDARGVEDDGSTSFFCSNFVWLPLNATLRAVIGVARRGEDPDPRLRSSVTYETAYDHLSRLLPPCRNCGCERFDPLRTIGADGV